MISGISNLHLLSKIEIDEFIDSLIEVRVPTSLGFINQHAYNLILSDSLNKDSFSDLDYMLRDGKGIELACKYWKLDPGLNLNGTDFIPFLISRIETRKIPCSNIVYGTSSPWLESGAAKLIRGEKLSVLNGFESIDKYIEHYIKHENHELLNVVILAMGMPKQEHLAKKIKAVASSRVLIICGGAIIDFKAERFKRAPLIFRTMGIEWFYRLVVEPRRMFRRYVIGIPIFFYNVIRFKLPSLKNK